MIDLSNPDHLKLVRRAASAVIGDQYASEARLVRVFRISKSRAGEVMDLLEERGIVGPAGVGVSRDVLIRADQRRTVLDAEFPGDGAA